MALRIVFSKANLGAEYKRQTALIPVAIAKASTLAYRGCAMLIKSRGEADIARSGKFGARWLNGLSVVSTPRQGFSITNSIIVGHDQEGARNFEFGGIVTGKPLLWIPLSFSDAKGRRAREFPGGLFRVNRPGKRPLLLSIVDKKPKYVGARRVRIPQKWHLREISRDVMTNSFIPLYNRFLNLG